MKENIIINTVNTNVTHRPGTILVGLHDALIDGFYLDTASYNFFKDPLAIHNISPTTTPFSNTYTEGFIYGINEGFEQSMLNTANDSSTPNYNKFLIDSSNQISSNLLYENNLTYHYIPARGGICTFSHKYNRYLDGIFKTADIPNIYISNENGIITYISNSYKIIQYNVITLQLLNSVNLMKTGYSKLSILSYDEAKVRYIIYNNLNSNDSLKYNINEIDLKSLLIQSIREGQINKLRYKFDPNGFFSNTYIDQTGSTIICFPALDDAKRGIHLIKMEANDNLTLLDDKLNQYLEPHYTSNRVILRIVNGDVITLRNFINAENQNTYPMTINTINLNNPIQQKIILKSEQSLSEYGYSIQSHKSIYLLDAIGKHIAIYSDIAKSYLILKYNYVIGKYIQLRVESNSKGIFIDKYNNKLISYKLNNSIRLSVLNHIMREVFIEYPTSYVKYEGTLIPITIYVYVLNDAEFESKSVKLQIAQGGEFSPGVYESTIFTNVLTKTSLTVYINSVNNLQINAEILI